MFALKTNTKDAMVGFFKNPPGKLSFTGSPRGPSLTHKYMWENAWIEIRDFFLRLLFRRVSPAETKSYALARNSFAILAMLAIIFRTCTAIISANTGFETHVYSGSCPGPLSNFNVNDIQLAIQVPDPDRQAFDFGINVTMASLVERSACVPEVLPAMALKAYDGHSFDVEGSVWFVVYTCTYPGNLSVWQAEPSQISYDIRIWSLNGTALRSDSMPHIWLVNRADSFIQPSSSIPTLRSVTPWLVRRRFIRSSIWRDTIANLEPLYDEVAIFPITNTYNALPTPDNNAAIAIGKITPTLQPVYSAFQTRLNFDRLDWYKVGLNVCDYVQDYRTSTFFGIIGSVGGLFAILQAWHVLLFGRPMLWGLLGAKLVTPFGMLGACSSRSFRRRLREQYYHTPDCTKSEENMRVGAFLRDFVIDFGPAGAEDDREESTRAVDRQGPTFSPLTNRELAETP
ncbi:monovalent cation/proton antiporter-2 (CPA2) family protein [Ceratobasidium sp. AG-Ba]|nr:monovalent cation/proton antiporter-2 (CPA2) family protein [Ceratobasidium sp. AG-Ba]